MLWPIRACRLICGGSDGEVIWVSLVVGGSTAVSVRFVGSSGSGGISGNTISM